MNTIPDPVEEHLAKAHQAGHWEDCVRIVEDRWLHLLGHTDLALLGRVLFDLPPELRCGPGVVRHFAEFFELEPIAEVRVPTCPDDVGALARSDLVRAFVERTTLAIAARRAFGSNRLARSLAVAVAEVVARTSVAGLADGPDPRPGNNVTDLKTFFHLQSGLAAQYADDRPLALRMFGAAWRERAYDSTGFAARSTAVRLAVEAALSGEAGEAARWLDTAEDQPRTPGIVEEMALQGVWLTRYLLAQDSLDHPAMEEARRRIAERHEQWPFVLWASARHTLISGEPARALDLVVEARAFFPRSARSDGLHRGLMATVQAEAELALGNANRALATLAGCAPTSYFGEVTLARLALLAGDHRQARSRGTETAARPGVTRRARVESLLIVAAAEARLDQAAECTATVQRAATLLRAGGPATALLGVPRAALEDVATLVPAARHLLAQRDGLGTADLYPASVDLVQLTERETRVLEHLAAGMSRDKLARTLFVSENTVKTQLRSIYAKLGVTAREAALARAHDLGLLDEGMG